METTTIAKSAARLVLMTVGLMLLGSDADSNADFILAQLMAAACFCLFFKLNK